MPNIEIKGFFKELEYELIAANRLQEKIWKALGGAAYLDQVVISRSSENAVGHRGGAIRYLRIWFAKDEIKQISDLIERLSPLKLRIECAILAGLFVPSGFREELAQDELPFPEGAYPAFPPGWGASS